MSFANFFHILTSDVVQSTCFFLGFLLILPPLSTKDLFCRERNQPISRYWAIRIRDIQIWYMIKEKSWKSEGWFLSPWSLQLHLSTQYFSLFSHYCAAWHGFILYIPVLDMDRAWTGDITSFWITSSFFWGGYLVSCPVTLAFSHLCYACILGGGFVGGRTGKKQNQWGQESWGESAIWRKAGVKEWWRWGEGGSAWCRLGQAVSQCKVEHIQYW